MDIEKRVVKIKYIRESFIYMLFKFNCEKRFKLDYIFDMELWEIVIRFNESVSFNVFVVVIVKNLVMKWFK